MTTQRKYDLVVRTKAGTHRKLTAYPMPHAECEVMARKFNKATRARILYVENKNPDLITWRY